MRRKFRCAAYYEVIALVQTLPPPPNHYQHFDTALLLQLAFDLASGALLSSTSNKSIYLDLSSVEIV